MDTKKQADKAAEMEKNKKPAEDPVKDPKEKKPAEAAEEKTKEKSEKPTAEEEKLGAELERIQKELNQIQDQYRRMLAEYDNYRKRSQREKENTYGDAVMATAGVFLPILDNLERAAAQPTADEAYKKGVELTLKQLYDCLEKLQIREIPALGEPFNPELHNAVMHVEDDKVDENIIIEVFQKGFTLNDRVLRHAMVKVAN